MNRKLCIALAAGAWVSGFMVSFVITLLMSQKVYCDRTEIDHFFHDLSSVIKCSCSDTFLIEVVTSLMSATCTTLPFLFTVAACILTIITILRIPSATGGKRHFPQAPLTSLWSLFSIQLSFLSTCYQNLTFNKLFSVFYTVVTPMVNPLIYTLRNKEVRGALGKEVQVFMGLYKWHIKSYALWGFLFWGPNYKNIKHRKWFPQQVYGHCCSN